MELTPEQIAALNALPALTKQVTELAPIAAKVPTLEAELAKRDAKIADLEKGVGSLSTNFQNSSALTALKSEYPDVPEASLTAALALPAEARKSLLDPMQKKATEFKATIAKTDPKSGWADAGSIQPATDAERFAQKEEKRKAYVEHAKTGNVFGMLDQRASEFAAHVRRSLTPQ